MNPSPILGRLWKPSASLPPFWRKLLEKMKGRPETTFSRENLRYWFRHRIVAPLHNEIRQAHIQQFYPWIPVCFNSIHQNKFAAFKHFQEYHIKSGEREWCWKSSLVSNVIYLLLTPFVEPTRRFCTKSQQWPGMPNLTKTRNSDGRWPEITQNTINPCIHHHK